MFYQWNYPVQCWGLPMQMPALHPSMWWMRTIVFLRKSVRLPRWSLRHSFFCGTGWGAWTEMLNKHIHLISQSHLACENKIAHNTRENQHLRCHQIPHTFWLCMLDLSKSPQHFRYIIKQISWCICRQIAKVVSALLGWRTVVSQLRQGHSAQSQLTSLSSSFLNFWQLSFDMYSSKFKPGI